MQLSLINLLQICEMKLSKAETNLLALERFIKKIHSDFSSISHVSIVIPFIEDEPKSYNSKSNLFPLIVRIQHNNQSSTYDWKNSSDDEYPIYDNDGNHYGYQSVKSYIRINLPEAFSGKAFYSQELIVSSNSIDDYISNIKIKQNAFHLDQELKSKKIIKKKIKI